MVEVVHMGDEHQPLKDNEWLDGALAPIPEDSLVRLIVIYKDHPFKRYCFFNITESTTLSDLKELLKPAPQLLRRLYSSTTEVVIQDRVYIPGRYICIWGRIEKEGRYTPWKTIRVLKESVK